MVSKRNDEWKWGFDVHEGIQRPEEENESTSPTMNNSELRRLLCFSVLLMVQEAETKLAKQECHNYHTNNLMRRVESTRLAYMLVQFKHALMRLLTRW